MTNNTGILDSSDDTNVIILTSKAKMVTTNNKEISENLSDNAFMEPKIDNGVVFMGKKYQDVQNKKVKTGIVLGAQTRSKSFGFSTSKFFEDKTYTQAVLSPVNTSNLANGRKFTVLKRNTLKSE